MANPSTNFTMKLSKIVGDRTAKALLEELGLETLEDLLRHYPRKICGPWRINRYRSAQ
ncbi:MAG: RecG wedge domain [Actinomycetota bacterium]